MLNDRLGDEGRASHLPATDTQQEANHVGLLLLLNLFHVFEGTHLEKPTVSFLSPYLNSAVLDEFEFLRSQIAFDKTNVASRTVSSSAGFQRTLSAWQVGRLS